MKKYLFSGLIILSSLFLTGCVNKNNSSNIQSENNSNTQEEENYSFSLRKLITQNIPQKCSYTGTNQEGAFTSEIIVSGQKFNQIITLKSSEGEEKINSISDGQYVYTWGKHATGASFAIKLKADFEKQVNSENQSTDQEVAAAQVDLDTDYQGKCSTVTVTDSDFQPPKDIKFEDYSKFLDDLKSSIPSINPKDLE